MDTLTLRVTIEGGLPIRAVIVLPFHPVRWLGWRSTTTR
jgi:hypothetical protein